MSPVGPYKSPFPGPIKRTKVGMAEIDLKTHGLTGWPHVGQCPHCGAPAVHLSSTVNRAHYECRGRNGDYTGSPTRGYCGTFKVHDADS